MMFMMNNTCEGNLVSVPINLTEKMEAYLYQWTNYATLSYTSLYLTAGTIYGGLLNDTSSTSYNIPFYISNYTG